MSLPEGSSQRFPRQPRPDLGDDPGELPHDEHPPDRSGALADDPVTLASGHGEHDVGAGDQRRGQQPCREALGGGSAESQLVGEVIVDRVPHESPKTRAREVQGRFWEEMATEQLGER